MRVVECVPNISEGRRPEIHNAVAQAAASVAGVTLLDVDPGSETNRTVITFVGEPEAVLEGAWQLLVRATALIDMTTHSGAHARMGAVDVVPFVPISGVTMEECVELARRLGARAGAELGLPIFLYERAATTPGRRNLADVRAGEYEGLAQKLAQPEWAPDFGPAKLVPRSGATIVGARKLLVAYNINLNTQDKRLANRVAFDIREKGRMRRDAEDQPILDAAGEPIWDPGLLKGIKATGWTIPEYGCAQISINITDLDETPLHVVFETACERATSRGLRVTGSELVGLVPRDVLLQAGRHALTRMGRSTGVSEEALVHIATRTLGLNEVKPFVARERVIEYLLGTPPRLAGLSLRAFADELASESPAPGGGSVAALAGALGAGLATMVANLSHPKKGYEARQPRLEAIAVRGQALKDSLLAAVDADTAAFDGLLAAMRLPQATDEDRARRDAAMAAATVSAIEIPLAVLEAMPEIVELCVEVSRIGIPASLSDAGTGLQMARAGGAGAYQNVCINTRDLTDRSAAARLLARADAAWKHLCDAHAAGEAEILGGLRAGAGR